MRRNLFIPLVLVVFTLSTAAALQSWNRYEFKKAKLSVMMPVGDWQEETTKDDQSTSYEVSVTVDAVNYRAKAIKFKGSALNGVEETHFRDTFYDQLGAGFRTAGFEISSERKIELNGMVGIEYDLQQTSTNVFLYTRTLFHEGRALVLIMGRSGDWPSNFFTDTFFGSPRWEE